MKSFGATEWPVCVVAFVHERLENRGKMADVFSAVKPLVIVAKYIGLAPFVVDTKKKTLKVFAPALIYSGLTLIAFTTNAAFLTYTKLINKDKRIDSYVGLASDVILLTSGIVVTVCCILLSMVQRKKYIRVVQDFHSVGFEMTKLKEQIPYKTVWKRCLRYLVLLFVVLSLLFFHTIFYIRNLSTLLYISYMYAWYAPKIYNFLMEYQFVSGVLLLKIHFDLLNKSLEKFDEFERSLMNPSKALEININNNAWPEDGKTFHFNGLAVQCLSNCKEKITEFRSRKIWPNQTAKLGFTTDLEKIKIIRKIYSNLCEVREYLNSSFSLQLLASVAQAFIFITVNLYMIFTTLSKSTASSALALSYPILWFLTHAVELVIIVLTCTNTSKAVSGYL